MLVWTGLFKKTGGLAPPSEHYFVNRYKEDIKTMVIRFYFDTYPWMGYFWFTAGLKRCPNEKDQKGDRHVGDYRGTTGIRY